MKNVMVGLVLAIVVVMSAVVVHAQQGVAGTWAVSVQGMSLEMVLAQDGEKISGTLDSPQGLIHVKGEFSKGKLTLAGASTDAHAVQVGATATTNTDGSLSGTISANLMDMNFTAVRSAGK